MQRFLNSLPLRFSPESKLNTGITKVQASCSVHKTLKSPPYASTCKQDVDSGEMNEDHCEHHRNGGHLPVGKWSNPFSVMGTPSRLELGKQHM